MEILTTKLNTLSKDIIFLGRRCSLGQSSACGAGTPGSSPGWGAGLRPGCPSSRPALRCGQGAGPEEEQPGQNLAHAMRQHGLGVRTSSVLMLVLKQLNRVLLEGETPTPPPRASAKSRAGEEERLRQPQVWQPHSRTLPGLLHSCNSCPRRPGGLGLS